MDKELNAFQDLILKQAVENILMTVSLERQLNILNSATKDIEKLKTMFKEKNDSSYS